MRAIMNTKLRRKLFAYSFTHQDESYYVRELASYIHEDPGNLSRELRKLEEEGIYTSSARGKLKFYSLSKKYSLYKELKAIVFKTVGVEACLKELAAKHAGIEIAFLYGSYAKNKEKASSDIDMVVVGSFNRDTLTQDIRTLEQKLDREINFNSYEKVEFKNEIRKTGSFLNLVLKEKIVLLKGSPYAG